MRMKGLILCILLVIALCIIPLEQAQAAMPTIKADKQYYDIAQGVHVLKGNVYIAHKNRVVTVGTAKTNMVEVWGTGGVRYTENDIALTGNSIYANFMKKKVALEGGVTFEHGDVKIIANSTDFSWKTKIAEFKGNVQCSANGITWTSDYVQYNVQTNQFI